MTEVIYWVAVRKDNKKKVSHWRSSEYDTPFVRLWFRKRDCVMEIGADKDYFEPRKIELND